MNSMKALALVALKIKGVLGAERAAGIAAGQHGSIKDGKYGSMRRDGGVQNRGG